MLVLSILLVIDSHAVQPQFVSSWCIHYVFQIHYVEMLVSLQALTYADFQMNTLDFVLSNNTNPGYLK